METGLSIELVSMPMSAHAAQSAFARLAQWSLDLHLIHTIEGRGVLHVGREAIETTPGTVIVVPFHEHCHWQKARGAGWTMINLHLRAFDGGGQALHERQVLPRRFVPDSLDDIHRKLRGWHADISGDDPELGFRARCAAVALVGTYLATFGVVSEPSDGVSDVRFARLRDQVRQMANRPFDGAELASLAGLSVSQTNRLFRAHAGMSPKRFWLRHRLGLAQSMLANGSTPIQAVADSLGFSDIYYFSRWFHQHAGLSPTAFRRSSRRF